VQRDGAFRKPAFSHGINGTCLISEQDSAGSLGLVPPVTRPEPPLSGDERAMVTVWLDYQRATLQWKCDGLEGRLLVHQGVPPSTLSLLGLVRHMTVVEWFWFEHIFGGGDSPKPISTDHDPDADFNDLLAERAGADLDLFRRAVRRVAGHPGGGARTGCTRGIQRPGRGVPALDHDPHD
jgi:hypothetical protein